MRTQLSQSWFFLYYPFIVYLFILPVNYKKLHHSICACRNKGNNTKIYFHKEKWQPGMRLFCDTSSNSFTESCYSIKQQHSLWCSSVKYQPRRKTTLVHCNIIFISIYTFDTFYTFDTSLHTNLHHLWCTRRRK